MVLLAGCGSTVNGDGAGAGPDDPVVTEPTTITEPTTLPTSDDLDDAAPTEGSEDLLADTTGDGPFYVDSATVRVAESYPVQLFLNVEGNAPTPCHQVAYTVDAAGDEIEVTITTVVEGDMCAQMLQPHILTIPLGSADLPVAVTVNDEHSIDVTD